MFHHIYNGKPIRSLIRNLKCRKTLDTLQVQKTTARPRLLYPPKRGLKFDREIKTFHDEYELKQFVTSKSALHKILRGILYREKKNNPNRSTGKRGAVEYYN